MFKRSILSLTLVLALACPAVQAHNEPTNTAVSAKGFIEQIKDFDWSEKVAHCAAFIKGLVASDTYKKAYLAVKQAYTTNGLRAVGEAIRDHKTAATGFGVGIAALAGTAYALYNYFGNSAKTAK